jgi:DNA polymerase elongation subunit (family B)
MKTAPMRILTIDIETSPILGYVWGLWQQNLMIDRIVEPTRMLSWVAKWYGSDEVIWASEFDHGTETMVREIYELVNEADVVVGFNSIKFDMKHLNREFVQLGLPVPDTYKNIDLLSTVKYNFNFPSNKLDYVAGVLLGEHKAETGGFQLWRDCLEGKKEAWEKMVEYNIQDVIVTENLYTHLRGWIKNHPNHGLYIDDQQAPVCRNCGSENLTNKGGEFTDTNVFRYQRYKCNDCGANMRGRDSVKGGRKKSKQVLI